MGDGNSVHKRLHINSRFTLMEWSKYKCCAQLLGLPLPYVFWLQVHQLGAVRGLTHSHKLQLYVGFGLTFLLRMPMLLPIPHFVVSITYFMIYDISCHFIFLWNVCLSMINSSITDCIAPYNIDVKFDALNDLKTTASNTLTSCGK